MTDHAEQLRRLDAEAAERTRDEARRYVRELVRDVDTPGNIPGDGSYTYDTRRARSVGFMLAGGGPTVYAWFTVEGATVLHALLEHSDDRGGSVFVEIPDHRAQAVYRALMVDARAREARR